MVSGAVFFLEAAEQLSPVLDLAHPGDVVIAPRAGAATGERPAPAAVTVIRYDGRWCEPGDRMQLGGGETLELQDYLTMPSLSTLGATVVRQWSSRGVDAFLEDADVARRAGVFVDQLVSGDVVLDSRASLAGGEAAAAALLRVHVTETGECRDGPDGLLLGHVDEARSCLETKAADGGGAGRAFDRICDRDELNQALGRRPWLGRYLVVLDIIRRSPGASVSGFGGHLVSVLDEYDELPAITSATAPFLMTGVGEGFVLVDPVGHRRFRIDVDDARAAECLIATGEEPAATALLRVERGGRPSALAAEVRRVRTRFDALGLDLTAFAARQTA